MTPPQNRRLRFGFSPPLTSPMMTSSGSQEGELHLHPGSPSKLPEMAAAMDVLAHRYNVQLLGTGLFVASYLFVRTKSESFSNALNRHPSLKDFAAAAGFGVPSTSGTPPPSHPVVSVILAEKPVAAPAASTKAKQAAGGPAQ